MLDCTLYHNPRCSKSRAALALLRERGIEPVLRAYLESPPSTSELRDLLAQLGLRARDLLRNGEEAFVTLGLSNPALGDTELIAAMHAHPQLIERPVFIRGQRAVIGRPPERVFELLD